MPAVAPSRVPALRRPSLDLRLDSSRLAAFVRPPIWPAIGVAAVAGALRVFSLDGTRTNPYYDAAVRTMSLSLHNFFYGVFTPGGQLAIDKPPVDLWFQVASVKLFGFSPEALILPQALAASIACALLFDLVRRPFGRAAGIASGLALAVLPISVVTSRSDTMDSLMMALMVLAAWLVVRAAQTGRARWLYLAAVVIGLDFEVKLFESLVVLPAVGLLYWIASREPLRRRFEQLALAVVVFVAVALSWPILVSLTPASSRPYPIGSTNGSVWNSIFVFNGTNRVSPPTYPVAAPARAPRTTHKRHHGGQRLAPPHTFRRVAPMTTTTGAKRLFVNRGYDYAGQIGVELVAAFAFGALATAAWAAFALRRRPPPGSARLQIGMAVAVAAWLLPGFYLWSTVNLLHPRYLESITPAIAAAAGIGLASLVRLASLRVAGIACLAAGLALTTLFALQRAALGGLETVVVAAAVLAVVAAALSRVGIRMLVPVACALALVAVLVPPLHNSLARVRGHSTDSGFPGSMSSKTTTRLSRYLRAHQRGAHYELAASSWNTALPIIVRDARPVLALTSVLQRPVVSVGKLRALVKAREVRYVMIGGGCGKAVPSHLSRCPASVAWVRRHSVDVTHKAGIKEKGLLWRLRTHAAAGRRSSTGPRSRSRATRAAHRRARGG